MDRNLPELDSAPSRVPATPVKARSRAQLYEALNVALDSIWSHKLRSVLTLLGIIIGVASVVTVGGAIEGLGSYMSETMSSMLASNTFEVARIASPMSLEDYDKRSQRNKNIYPEDVKAVQGQCATCDAISPLITENADAKRGNSIFYDANVSGVNADYIKIQSLDLAEGRFISRADVSHARAFAVIGAQIREELFGPVEALGKQIKLDNDTFTVIGVEVRNGNMMGQLMDGRVYIPYTAFLKKYGFRRTIDFRVKGASDTPLENTQDEVRQIMRTRHKLKPDQKDDFDVLASNAVQDFIGEVTGAIEVVITPITLISLLVGGIVVMNIMLVTVTERTAEIGMRKAVGASRRDILLQFLVESAFLTSLGGGLGILIAYITSLTITGTTSVPMHITAAYIVMAMLTSGGIGIISGIYPAYRASQLSPITALARE